MANMELIETKTVGSGGASSIDFTSITSAYTDLKLVCSTRSSSGDVGIWIRINGDSAQSYTWKMVWGGGSGNYGSYSQTVGTNYDRSFFAYAEPNTYTANTFSNVEIYVPNYRSSVNKTISIDGVGETNADTAYRSISNGTYTTSSPITQITILVENGTANFVEGSTVSLYGISNVTSSPKATGGIVSQDATYWYHTFPFSSTFTPTSALSADILCIAGGGGGGWPGGAGGAGGGGAGGLLALTSQSLSVQNYAVTVGAGGTAVTNDRGNSGGNSQFGALTAAVGGGGGGRDGANTGNFAGRNGGSGGGGGINADGTGVYAPGGTATSGQGNNGGQGWNAFGSGAGGGGAGAAGTNVATQKTATAGGVGSTTYSSWGLATFTGQIVGGTAYFAGGGGGGAGPSSTTVGGGAGIGGGGLGGGDNQNSTAGLTNTGGGGGAGGYPNGGSGQNGGSGLVIVRYAK